MDSVITRSDDLPEATDSADARLDRIEAAITELIGAVRAQTVLQGKFKGAIVSRNNDVAKLALAYIDLTLKVSTAATKDS